MKAQQLLLVLALCLLAGCVVVNNKPTMNPTEVPPFPVMPNKRGLTTDIKPKIVLTQQTRPLREGRILRAGTNAVTAAPHWTFATGGDYRIDACTNLAAPTWQPVAIVYGVTNVTIVSKTVNKRNMMFYRLTKL